MTEDSAENGKVAVLVPTPAETPYTYALPAGMNAPAGAIVQVPLGPRMVAGVVWDRGAGAVDPRKIRPVSQVFDCPPLTADMRRFIDWVAAWTLSPPGMVARMALRAPAAFEPEAPLEGLRLTAIRPDRMTAARARIISIIQVKAPSAF